jgi:hypothetical protein
MMKRGPWALDPGLWVIYHGGRDVYEIILSSYFCPLLRRYCAPCATHRSPGGKKIIIMEGDSLLIARGPWALYEG